MKRRFGPPRSLEKQGNVSLQVKKRVVSKTSLETNVPKKKVAKVKEIRKSLKDKFYISDDVAFILEGIDVDDEEFRSKVPEEQVENLDNYSEEIRCFALTLHFYSVKGYDFVRKTYVTCLPPASVVIKWHQSENGQPGFSKESIEFMKIKANESNKKIYATIMFDIMPLKGDVEYDCEEQKEYGYIDFGVTYNAELQDSAREALVFYLVPINAPWKVLLGYFLLRLTEVHQKYWLLKEAIRLAETAGINVRAITLNDRSYKALAKKSGCEFDHKRKKYNWLFKNPCNESQIAVFFDPTRNIDGVRNALERYTMFQDKYGKAVTWKDLVKLHNAKIDGSLHLKNRLRAANLFLKSKIVKIEDEDTITNKKCLPEAPESELDLEESEIAPTLRFVELICDLFDILDSYILGKGLKQAINAENAENVIRKLMLAKDSLVNLLTESSSVPDDYDMYPKRVMKLVETPTCMSFVGLCVSIDSAMLLINDFILNKTSEDALKQLPLHKTSLDHLEHIFASIRSLSGVKYEPTARQFVKNYKKLMIIRDNLDLDKLSLHSEIERINTTTRCKDLMREDYKNCESENSLDFSDILKSEVEFSKFEAFKHVSEYGDRVLEYNATLILTDLIDEIKCQACLTGLIGVTKSDVKYKKDAKYKIYSGSETPIEICRRCEVFIKRSMIETYGRWDIKALPPKYNAEYFTRKVLKSFIGCDMFPDISYHQFEIENVNHLIELTKCVIKKYVNGRLLFLNDNDAMKNRQKLREQFLDFLACKD